MSGDKSSRKARGVEPIEFAKAQWREMYEALAEAKASPHPGASFLAYYRDQMVASYDRLLELGLDVSDLSNPRVAPVPAARHPKTKGESERWEAEISFWSQQHLLSFSVAGVGAHVVYSAVGDEPLVEVLAGYVSDPAALPREDIAALISESGLEYLALACSLWFLEPTGSMKSSAADLDAECLNRMLYAFEINPLIRIHRQAKDDKLSEAERLASVNAAAGWSLANLSWTGKPGDALRSAVGEEYERFLEELPSASLIAWRDREPEEPLRSTRHREKNLARRAAASIEKVGNEDATKPGKLVHDTFGLEGQEVSGPVGEAIGSHDELLDEVELRLTAEQELGQLAAWVEKAKLSEQQRRVYELDMQTDYNTASIARELEVSTAQVRNVRKHYHDKIRKAAGQ